MPSVKLTSRECNKVEWTPFLVAVAFKMAPWAGLSSLTAGHAPLAQETGGRMAVAASPVTVGGLRGQSLMCATLTCLEGPSKVARWMVLLS